MARTMRKPNLYLDTNILSVMCYRGPSQAATLQRDLTRDWWDEERQHFQLFSSPFTEVELSKGKYAGQKQALRLVRRLSFLAITRKVKSMIAELLDSKLVPESSPGDAVHLAICIVYEVDYLLSWNHSHLVNADVESRLRRFVESRAYESPRLVSPQSIPQVRLGQEIRRRQAND